MNLSENDDTNEELIGVLDNLEKWVFSKENWNDTDFYKIWEITYSYKTLDDWSILNVTLFCKLGWMSIDDFKEADLEERNLLIQKAKTTLLQKVLKNKWEIEQALIKIKWITTKDKVLLAHKQINEWGLEEALLHLNLLEEWIEFDVEKALVGLYFNPMEWVEDKIMGEKLRSKLMVKVDKINAEVYWEKLKNNSKYVVGCIDYFYTKYENYKIEKSEDDFPINRKLTKDEIIRYEWYLQKVYNLSLDHTPALKFPPEEVINQNFDKIDLTPEEMEEFFNLSYGATDKQSSWMWHKAELNDDVAGMTDHPGGLFLPLKPSITHIERILELDPHELGQHSTSLVRHMKLVWNIRWKWNLEVAEWTAILLELLFKYWENLFKEIVIDWKTVSIIDVENLPINSYFPKKLAEDALFDEELYDFLQLQHKVEPDRLDPHLRYLRQKRTWQQSKDYVYQTGLYKAAAYINDIILWKRPWASMNDLIEWKVWFKDIDAYKIIVDDAEQNNITLDNEILKLQWKVSNLISPEDNQISENVIDLQEKIAGLEEKKVHLPEMHFFHEAVNFVYEQKIKRKAIDENNRNISQPELKKIYKEEWAEVTLEALIVKLKIKYPWFDFTEREIDVIKFWFKKHVMKAVNIFENATERSLNDWLLVV